METLLREQSNFAWPNDPYLYFAFCQASGRPGKTLIAMAAESKRFIWPQPVALVA